MRKRSNPLAYCRQRSRVLARALLPILFLGSLGAAGTCPAMAGAAADGAAADLVAHAGHGDAPSAGDHSSDHGHDPGHDHGACPHCPTESGSGASGGHALCAAFDEAANSKHASKPGPPDLKLAPPAELQIVAAMREPLVESRRLALYHRLFPPSIPLNLRHCVFVI
ncbi:MAG TPA: hypothetical protein VMR74_02060 [Gammaproteobacteria bacterium]|nr:hypothetical protein [Gammaproteobacteria bacterium]